MEWSDSTPEEVDAPVLRGLGRAPRAEARARPRRRTTPSASRSTPSKVRIVDVVARTEVDETFTNDTDEELEGIYRFPLPPGAQIEKLSLEVDGKLVDGAFVDRDRGAAIWRGVIQNAAPKAPKPSEEIIWVPGPWRDPALLEWQRGGRFELKIFPIPKHGSRRVVLTYTQIVDQAAGVRRFTYPLAHDASGTTKVDSFDLDVQVLGARQDVRRPDARLRAHQRERGGDGDRRDDARRRVRPRGRSHRRVRAPRIATRRSRPGPTRRRCRRATLATTPATPAEPKAGRRARREGGGRSWPSSAIADDSSPYVVAIARAIRAEAPALAGGEGAAPRRSSSTRAARCSASASRGPRTSPRRSSARWIGATRSCSSPATRLQADGRCDSGASDAARVVPGAAAAERRRALPRPGRARRRQRSRRGRCGGARRGGLARWRELRVIYLGDGTPTVGPTRPAHLEAAVRSAHRRSATASVVAVALGADADTVSLGALARGGGGVVVPYVPGQRVSLGGARRARARLRRGRSASPRSSSRGPLAGHAGAPRSDPRRRRDDHRRPHDRRQRSLPAALKLKGRVGRRELRAELPAQDRSPPRTPATPSSRASTRRPRSPSSSATAATRRSRPSIELSRRFSVASRFTSLLVLESEAMFKAFGVDRTADGDRRFTGEQGAESSSADGDVAVDGRRRRGRGDGAKTRTGQEREGGTCPAPSQHARASAAASPRATRRLQVAEPVRRRHGSQRWRRRREPQRAHAPAQPAAPAAAATAAPASVAKEERKARDSAAPAPPPPPAEAQRDGHQVAGEEGGGTDGAATTSPSTTSGIAASADVAMRRRGFVPMSKVFDRKTSFDAVNTFATRTRASSSWRRRRRAPTPDSRDKTVELFALYATTGPPRRGAGAHGSLGGPRRARPRRAPRPRRSRRAAGRSRPRHPHPRRPRRRAAQRSRARRRASPISRTPRASAALACEHRISLADIAPDRGQARRRRRSAAPARQGMSDLASRLEVDAGDKVRDRGREARRRRPADLEPRAVTCR